VVISQKTCAARAYLSWIEENPIISLI